MNKLKHWYEASPKLKHSIFLAGTGTGVGKTHVAADLMRFNPNVKYWKPIQSGLDGETDTATVRRLSARNEADFFPEQYRLKEPASPHQAASKENKILRVQDFSLPNSNSLMLVEGAGGLKVPLNLEETMLDLMVRFELPVWLVSGVYLGSINHTLLSIEALKNAGLRIEAVLFNGPANPDSELAIMQLANIPDAAWYRRDYTAENKQFPEESQGIIHPFTRYDDPEPLPIVSGKGVYLFDKEGRSYIDACSSWWTNLHGHSNSELSTALQEQAQVLQHVLFGGVTHPAAERLAEKMHSLTEQQFDRIFFSDNGSTAVEVALKMAWQGAIIRGKPVKKFLAIQGSYHGDTFGAMAVGERDIFVSAFRDLLFQVTYLPFPSLENRSDIEAFLNELKDTEDIAGFIYEPMLQGAGGMRKMHTETLNFILTRLKSMAIPLIADEVMTGFGRTGTLFAYEQTSEVPDFLCLSKSLTGGTLPLALTLIKSEHYLPFTSSDISRQFFHGHSYTGNPLACAVALKSISMLTSTEGQLQHRYTVDKSFELVSMLGAHEAVSAAWHLGTLAAFQLKSSHKGYFYNDPMRNLLYSWSLSQGLMLRPLGNVVYVLPPYITGPEEWSEIQRILASLFNRVLEFNAS
jgi:adenosylmethionine-8-amino-7-oxononanoate aminotransferase